MTSSLGEAVLELTTDSSKLDSGVDSAKSKSQGLSSQFGVTKLAVVGAIAAMGAAAFKLGEDFDNATDRIRIGTGATGKQLESLNTSFKNVVGTVPSDMGEVATAIADLNTRLGLTGAPLEAMATQFLNLSRITGTDLATNVANITRVFGDWSIAAEDQSAAMDFLFKTSQATGIGLEKLSGLVVQFGAPLRQLGFDFETSAALMGKFEKEGVNIETVMSGMKIGLANLAKAGIDGKEGLAVAIEGIKEAGSQAEANTAAIALFGQRAGPDMAAAIREGRFELDDLTASLIANDETINEAAKSTDDFWESLKQIGNALRVAVGPAVEGVFGLMTKLLGPLRTGIALLVDSQIAAMEAGKTMRGLFGSALSSQDQKQLDALKQLSANIKNVKDEAQAAARPDAIPAVGAAVADTGGKVDKVRPSFDELMKRIKGTGDASGEAAKGVGTLRQEVERFDLAKSIQGMNALAEATDKYKVQVMAAAVESAGLPPIIEAMRQEADQTTTAVGSLGVGLENITVDLGNFGNASKSLGGFSERAKAAINPVANLGKQVKTTTEATGLWDKGLKQVSTVLTDLGSDLAGRFSNAVKTGIGPVDDFTKAIIRLVGEQVMGAMIKGLASIVGHIPGLSKLAGILTGIGGGAANAAGSAAGGIGGAAGGAGGAAGSAAGAGTAATVGAIAGVASAISGIIGNFQMAKMETTLNAIEEWTRRSMIHLGEGGSSILDWTQSSQAILWIIANNTASLKDGVPMLSSTVIDAGEAVETAVDHSTETLERISRVGTEQFTQLQFANAALGDISASIDTGTDVARQSRDAIVDSITALPEGIGREVGRRVSDATAENTLALMEMLNSIPTRSALGPTSGLPAGYNYRGQAIGPGSISLGDPVRGSRDVPSFQSGIDFLPQDTLALLHKGEAVIPAEENRGRDRQPVEIRVMLQTGKEIARALIPDINDLVKRNRYRLLASGVVA